MLESEEGGQLPVGHRVRSSQRQKFFYPSSIPLLFHTRFKSIFLRSYYRLQSTDDAIQ